MRKLLLGLVATAAIAAPLMTMATPASAAEGAQLIVNGDFSSSGPDGLLLPPATTDFQLAVPGVFGTGNGSMYDPGRYTIGTNPAAVHEAWADFGDDANDPMMIVNGFTEGSQKVWSQTITAPVCSTPGSKVTYDFTAHATNILPPEWAADRGLDAPGANLEVKINDVSIGQQNLTGVDAGQVVQLIGAVPAAASMVVTVYNNGTAYTGNDFAIDDISLTQRGDCEPPCQTVENGVWFNYTGKYTGTGTPALTDPKWHALPAQPGGQHDLAVRGFDKPYQPGVDKGKGDWFVWKDLGNTCPIPS